MKRHKGIYVVWLDSAGTNGWCLPDDVENAGTPMRCETLGFFVRETQNAIVVALNFSNAPRTARPYGELITIPKCAVVTRRWV